MSADLTETERLLEIMRALRDPQSGCPWDVAQSHASLKKYVIEEAYEVAEALDSADDAKMVDELGDLLFQVVFHAEIGRGEGRFEFEDIARAVSNKMEARHPHVFGDAGARSVEEQRVEWEAQKAEERQDAGALAGVSIALPPTLRAMKLQKRAARVGFDWDDVDQVWKKLDEELAEFKAASASEREDEFGDILFVLINLARHEGIDPEAALASTNRKFERRFASIEAALAKEGKAPEGASLDEMEALWQTAKRDEAGAKRD